MNKLDKYLLNIEWRKLYINNIETGYDISNEGLLRDSNTLNFIKPWITPDGYKMYSIKVENKPKLISAHRTVCTMFVPNPENKPTVNHKDGNKLNNHYSNLEWMTYQENTRHAIDMGLKWYHGGKGIENGNNKFTEEQIKYACELMEDPKNKPNYISELTGVSKTILYYIRRGDIWRHISKNYNINYINFAKGENNHKNKYTEEQIHEVCRLLEKGLNPKNISLKTRVSTDTILHVRGKNVWKDISDFYIFPEVDFTLGSNHIMSKYTDDMIHKVCKLLEKDNWDMNDITSNTGVSMHTIFKIVKGVQWKHIAKDYNIKPKTHKSRKSAFTEKVLLLLKEDKSYDEIVNDVMDEFNMTDRRKTLKKIYCIVSDLRKCEVQRLSKA